MAKYTDDQKKEAIELAWQHGNFEAAAQVVGCTRASVKNWCDDLKLQHRLGLVSKTAVAEMETEIRRSSKQNAATVVARDLKRRAHELQKKAILRREIVGTAVDDVLERTAEVLKANRVPVYDKDGTITNYVPLGAGEVRELATALKLLTQVSRQISGEELAEKVLLTRVKADAKAASDAARNLDMLELVEAIVVEDDGAEKEG